MSDAFNERLRLIRFRRKREHSKFTQELRVIPRWLIWTCFSLYLLALVIGLSVNLFNIQANNDNIFPPELRSQPLLASLALAGAITFGAAAFSSLLFMLGYVYRDAKRRGMHPALWTLVVLILSPGYGILGLIIYLLVREPLPYPCPQCATSVSARFNFCPNCKTNLRPACTHCQREVSDNDKFCPYCGNDLAQPPSTQLATEASRP
jgi:RNA polymerase subunit RPABC4/transcription elongation factor Spt4